MFFSRLVRSACLAGLIIGLAEPGTRAAPAPDPRTLLKEIAGFTDADWAAVDAGTAVAKVIDSETREIAIAGAVRIVATRELLASRIREVENLQRSAVVLNVGRFGRVPAPADLARAPFEDYSLDLRSCRAGDCRVRLGAADIARFHQEIDWRAADARERAARIWREVLSGYAAGYVSGGRKALPVYANRSEPLSVAAEQATLASRFAFVSAYSPELFAYLQEFGPRLPPGAEDVLYWTKEDFGVRPVLRISHQVLLPPSGARPVLVATNQVYADHYMDAALGVTLAVDAPNAGGRRAFYMIAVNRARTRSLSGILRRMIRGTVQSRSREAMRKILVSTKIALEASQGRL
jgi:hypothetical protein